jgi:hypothetical protein
VDQDEPTVPNAADPDIRLNHARAFAGLLYRHIYLSYTTPPESSWVYNALRMVDGAFWRESKCVKQHGLCINAEVVIETNFNRTESIIRSAPRLSTVKEKGPHPVEAWRTKKRTKDTYNFRRES